MNGSNIADLPQISGLQALLKTLLDEADQRLKKGDATTAGMNYEKARAIWKKNFSSLPEQLLEHQLRIYRGEVQVLTKKGKLLKGTSGKENLDNAKWFKERADIIHKFLVSMENLKKK